MLNAPAGKRLAPMLGELVPLLRRHGELDLDDDTADLLVGMSAATIDRKLAGARSKMLPHGRSHTKPGSILKSKIAMRTWADHDEDTPGFVEIDLVGHEGGNPRRAVLLHPDRDRHRHRLDGEPDGARQAAGRRDRGVDRRGHPPAVPDQGHRRRQRR